MCKISDLEMAYKGRCIKAKTEENTLYEFVKYNIGAHGGH